MILDRLFRNQADNDHQKTITTSADLERYLRGSARSAAGVDVTPTRAMQFMAVYTCVKILAESVGQLPHSLLQRGGKDGREVSKAIDHPLYQVLHLAPNENQTAQEFQEWLIASLALHGNAYAQINRVRGTVRELTPFTEGAVQPRQDPDTGEVHYRVRVAGGQVEELPPAEVLHVKLFSLGGLLGASPIAYARETIGMGIAAERHGAALFARNASPGGVLESPKEMGKEAYERLRDSWDQRHAGAENAHRTALLEGGVVWKSITMPSKDAQWLESRKYQRSEVFGIYRVPPHLGGDLDRATFSNIEHSSLDFVVHTLMPYLVRLEQRVMLQLLTPAERKVFYSKFAVGALLRGDMAARASFYNQMIQMGAYSPNEVRALEDLNPREGGDVYLTPANMLINGKPPSPPAPTQAEPDDPAPDPADE